MYPKKHILTINRTAHGGFDHLELERLNLNPEDIADFSVNVNPFGPAPEVMEAVRSAPIETYPDRKAIAFRRAVGLKTGLEPDQVLPSNGVAELIWLVTSAYLGETDSALIVGPTFGEYADAVAVTGAKAYHLVAEEKDDFILPLEAVVNLMEEVSPTLLFLCNPNNPTGIYLGRREVHVLLDSLGEGLLVLDEAYISFVEDTWPSVELLDDSNTIIMRSLTKDSALAGIRVGYALAHERIIEILEKVQPPWSVNAMAQAGGVAALGCGELLEESLMKLREARDYLITSFADLGFRVLPTTTNYFLVEVGGAAAFREKLLKRGFLVRDCTSFGLPTFIRVSPLAMEECRKLIETVSSLL